MNCTGCVANRTLGPRLVEHDGIDLRKALKGAAVLERHALLEQPPSRDNLNCRFALNRKNAFVSAWLST